MVALSAIRMMHNMCVRSMLDDVFVENLFDWKLFMRRRGEGGGEGTRRDIEPRLELGNLSFEYGKVG